MKRGYGPLVELDRPAFVHPSASIYGKVRIGEGASVWPHAVIRGEAFAIEIGPYSNIQDFCCLHVGGECGVRVGAYASITHHSTLHGAMVGDNCLIGINATLMDGVVIGDNSIVAGGAFVKEGTLVPPNSIAIGVPAKVVRARNNWVANRFNAALYHRNGEAYARGEHRAWDGPEFERWSQETLARLEREFETLFGGEERAPSSRRAAE